MYAFGPDPETDSKFAHVMTVVRNCAGEGAALRYHTEVVIEGGNGEPNEIIKVVWDGKSEATASDSMDPLSSKDKSQEAEAAQMLKDILREGKRPAIECHDLLGKEGYDLKALNAGRVRRKAGVASKKFSGEQFYSWYLMAPTGQAG